MLTVVRTVEVARAEVLVRGVVEASPKAGPGVTPGARARVKVWARGEASLPKTQPKPSV